MSRRQTMLFIRDYNRMLGGHLKVFDYANHVAASGLFDPVLYLTPESTAQPPSALLPSEIRIVRDVVSADAYFVAGFNWEILDQAGVHLGNRPVVNLIQGLRHGLLGDARSRYLMRPALRIGVSTAATNAVAAIGVNGPLVTIRNGVDTIAIERFGTVPKSNDVFIAATKNGEMGRAIAAELEDAGVGVDLACELLPRELFLRRMGRCSVALLLPHPYEGFFLPALEAMVLGCAVVIPAIDGISDFCANGSTCRSTAYEPGALTQAAIEVIRDAALAERLRTAARTVAAEYSLGRERREFHAVLKRYLESR